MKKIFMLALAMLCVLGACSSSEGELTGLEAQLTDDGFFEVYKNENLVRFNKNHTYECITKDSFDGWKNPKKGKWEVVNEDNIVMTSTDYDSRDSQYTLFEVNIVNDKLMCTGNGGESIIMYKKQAEPIVQKEMVGKKLWRTKQSKASGKEYEVTVTLTINANGTAVWTAESEIVVEPHVTTSFTATTEWVTDFYGNSLHFYNWEWEDRKAYVGSFFPPYYMKYCDLRESDGKEVIHYLSEDDWENLNID